MFVSTHLVDPLVRAGTFVGTVQSSEGRHASTLEMSAGDRL
jgi:hypothetical protein